MRLKFRAKFDDALDVVGVHFVGGLVGSLLIGFFANPQFFGGSFDEGIFYGGGIGLLAEQALANLVTIVYSFLVTTAILLVLKRTMGLRVEVDDEVTGLDFALHRETAYRDE